MQKPLLSLLFPLYRSKPFLENLVQQLERLRDPRYEIIISDRHCYDETIDLLQNKFALDKRFRFIKESDGLHWVSHYNTLLQQAKGKYFCWVPHDDAYEPNYFTVLVNKLENQSSAVMAFSVMHLNGKNDWIPDYSVFKKRFDYPFSSREYIELYNSGLMGIPFRGIFRRQTVIHNGLFIKQPKKMNGYQDLFWVFALLQYGGFVYTEETSCTKRFTKGSAHAEWTTKMLSRKNLQVTKLLLEYLVKSPLPFSTKIGLGLGFLMPSSIYRAIGRE